ncbi:MAG: sulfate reduction electron transfer complex DsrMKJOP subunit DsrP [Candidatus Korobacteraceae bacterium]|jgi:molybdopterin-containing oxidoreductase family membrane subunit
MFEKALVGSRRYWVWVGSLLVLVCAGLLAYLRQATVGLGITGLNHDVVWGLYIAQFVFFVGLGASAVVVVLPYYLHDWKAFGKTTVLGEILGMCSVIVAMLFILASMGQPTRVLNVLFYPHPNSLIFWDILVLNGYVLLNVIITVTLVSAKHEGVPPPKWIKPVIILSIPWAISIHTVTAFIFAGLSGRPFWMSPMLAPRFLVSAFSTGPALLIIVMLVLRKLKVFDAAAEVVNKLSLILTYCMLINVFFVLMELFTAFYSRIPEHVEHFQLLFFGLEGNHQLVPVMWVSVLFSLAALVLLLVPRWRTDRRLLPLACVLVFVSLWLDKGFALLLGGFVPSPLGEATRYSPTMPEWTVAVGIWALGALMITVLYKITISVQEEA